MQKKDLYYNIAIGIVVLAIVVVILFKFILPGKSTRGGFAINHFEKVTVLDLGGNQLKLADLVSKNESTYIFILELTNCNSCIYQGMEDLKKLKEAGKPCLSIVSHHLLDEVSGWSTTQDFSPFYMLHKHDFYEHIHSPVMPVLAKIRNGKVESFRYIRP